MQSFTKRSALVFATLTAAVSALDGIVAPSQVAADTNFTVTFQDANDDQYRVYLAASLAGSNGPTCYLINSTTLSDSVNITVPAGVGPSADYYSIAIADITSHQASTFSNRFNLTGATGNYTEYENHLGGSPFWSADDLPCSAYSCARECAQASYPDDLTSTSAYGTMKKCILACNGVTPAASQTAPAHASSTGSSTTMTGEMAVLTLGPDATITAIESTNSKGKTIAIIGDKTLTLGGSAATISSEAVSLATSGVAVGGSTTVAFGSTTATIAASATVADAASATQSGSSANGRLVAGAAAVGFAGLAFVL